MDGGMGTGVGLTVDACNISSIDVTQGVTGASHEGGSEGDRLTVVGVGAEAEIGVSFCGVSDSGLLF
jgi:hypothetical protein